MAVNVTDSLHYNEITIFQGFHDVWNPAILGYITATSQIIFSNSFSNYT